MSDFPTQHNWPDLAAALHKRVGGASIEPSVLQSLDGAGNILVACSGGADSVFLLCILVARAKELGLKLHVAHYNHRWRGEDSNADAAFVASLAQAFSLRFSSKVRPPKEAAFTETTARALRLDFLRNAAKKNGCEYIVYGHQLDDIMETQLQRIARGVASDGLAAPRPIARFEGEPTHLRPLIHLRAGDIRMALNASSIPWREDSSNDDVSIARNALRKEIIPDLANALARDPSLGAARTRRLLEEDAIALDQIARERLPEAYAHAAELARDTLRDVPSAILRRALAEWLNGHNLIASVGAPAMDLLIETLQSPRENYRMSAGSHFIVLDRQTLCLEDGEEADQQVALQSTSLKIGEPVFLSTGALIEAELVELDSELRQKLQKGEISPQSEAIVAYVDQQTFDLRAWQPGDRFQPLGAPGSKKLKDWFIDRHIPQAERKTLPLVVNTAGEVVWVPGFPPADSCKIQPSTKKALRLTYQTGKPL